MFSKWDDLGFWIFMCVLAVCATITSVWGK